ncbi:MAG: hypothetical protein AUI36_19800 [Cyanobacteria bacterium 13_1_40CM_2_61_4]|nr:MAG: hypothetical protein AUI36_19800 [Cyanobacteria bacterium 13_1_40CM_2_61_4]
MKRLRRFLELSAQERCLVVRAVLVMTAFRLGLRLLPLSRLLAFTRPAGHDLPKAGRADPAQIAWAVRVASRYVPRATCLVQALTAKALLENVGHSAVLHIGVAKARDDRLEAHAWVECFDTVISGGSDVARYTPMLSVEWRR